MISEFSTLTTTPRRLPRHQKNKKQTKNKKIDNKTGLKKEQIISADAHKRIYHWKGVQ